MRDDGVAVYVNGVEVGRDNLVAGAGATTLATAAIGNADETKPISLTVGAGLFLAGTNTIAVEIHQSSANSSDLNFDLALEGVIDASGARYFAIVNGNEIRTNATFADADVLVGSDVSLVLRSTDEAGDSIQRSFSVRVVSDDADDLDGDRLPDAWERQYFPDIFAQDGDDDSDGDGQTNLDEFLFLTAPNDGGSLFVLQIQRSGAGAVLLSWPSNSARRYTLQSTGSMSSGNWINTPGGVRNGNGATMNESVTNAAGGERQFRLVVERL